MGWGAGPLLDVAGGEFRPCFCAGADRSPRVRARRVKVSSSHCADMGPATADSARARCRTAAGLHTWTRPSLGALITRAFGGKKPRPLDSEDPQIARDMRSWYECEHRSDGAGSARPRPVADLQDALLLLISHQLIKTFPAPNRPSLDELQALAERIKLERTQSRFGDATRQQFDLLD